MEEAKKQRKFGKPMDQFVFAGGRNRRLYRSNGGIACAACTASIEVGAFYTHSVDSRRVCRVCQPFEDNPQSATQVDAITARLERGETLMIDDQLRSYITMKSGDDPKCFVMRSVLAWQEDQMKRIEMPPQYEEQRFGSLAEALLSLMDYEWRKEP